MGDRATVIGADPGLEEIIAPIGRRTAEVIGACKPTFKTAGAYMVAQRAIAQTTLDRVRAIELAALTQGECLQIAKVRRGSVDHNRVEHSLRFL